MMIRLSASIALAVFVLGAGAASAQSPKQEVVVACRADIERLCPNVPPGGGEIMKCLKAQRQQVSFGCKRAIFQAKEAHDAAKAAEGAPPPPH